MLRAVVHDEVVLGVPADLADDVERAVVERTLVEALSFDWAPPGAARTVQITADLAVRRASTWGATSTGNDRDPTVARGVRSVHLGYSSSHSPTPWQASTAGPSKRGLRCAGEPDRPTDVTLSP